MARMAVYRRSVVGALVGGGGGNNNKRKMVEDGRGDEDGDAAETCKDGDGGNVQVERSA